MRMRAVLIGKEYGPPDPDPVFLVKRLLIVRRKVIANNEVILAQRELKDLSP